VLTELGTRKPGRGEVDVVALALTAVLMVLFAFGPDDEPGSVREIDAMAVALFVGSFAALLARRRHPGPMALAILGMNFWWHKNGYANEAINVPTVLAFFSVGLTGDRRLQWFVGSVTPLAVVIGVAASDAPWLTLVDAIGWTVAALLLGELVRRRGQVLERYAERAERAEAEREHEAQRRVAEERLRIARELHDLLAHTVSAMSVQAEVAADAIEGGRARDDSGEVGAAVAAIQGASRDAMAEIRATVTVLRGADGATGTAPAPRIDRLPDLFDTARAAGLVVVDDVAAPGELPPMIELTAYRIVQEALTNVVRHAGATRVEVRLARDDRALVVEVGDDGRGAGATTSERADGFGLRGMAERVASLGGTLDLGPSALGGFGVRASLPLGGGAA
jgi:signal transduction histidine kinase